MCFFKVLFFRPCLCVDLSIGRKTHLEASKVIRVRAGGRSGQAGSSGAGGGVGQALHRRGYLPLQSLLSTAVPVILLKLSRILFLPRWKPSDGFPFIQAKARVLTKNRVTLYLLFKPEHCWCDRLITSNGTRAMSLSSVFSRQSDRTLHSQDLQCLWPHLPLPPSTANHAWPPHLPSAGHALLHRSSGSLPPSADFVSKSPQWRHPWTTYFIKWS